MKRYFLCTGKEPSTSTTSRTISANVLRRRLGSWSTRESVAVVYSASIVSIIVLVPSWNLRTGSHTIAAIKLLTDLPQRIEKFALSLHPDKTRLIEFRRFAVK